LYQPQIESQDATICHIDKAQRFNRWAFIFLGF